MVVRIAVVGAAVFAAIATWRAGPASASQLPPLHHVGRRHLLLAARAVRARRPGVLSYLTWETAKIRSTQSATGILYVDFFTVVVGEVLAKYLLLATRVPV